MQNKPTHQRVDLMKQQYSKLLFLFAFGKIVIFYMGINLVLFNFESCLKNHSRLSSTKMKNSVLCLHSFVFYLFNYDNAA